MMDLQLLTESLSVEESVPGGGWMSLQTLPDAHNTSGLSEQASRASGLSKTQRRRASAKKKARILSHSSIGFPIGGTPIQLPQVLAGLGSGSSGPARPPEKRQKQLAITADRTPSDPEELLEVCGPSYAANHRKAWLSLGHTEEATTFLFPKVPDADGVITHSLEDHVRDMRSITSRGGYSELYALSIAFEKRFVIHMAHSSATVTVLDAYPPHLSRLAVVPEELRIAHVNGVHYDPIVPMLPEDEAEAAAPVPTLHHDAAQRRARYRETSKKRLVVESFSLVKTTRARPIAQTADEQQKEVQARIRSNLTDLDRRNMLHSDDQREEEFVDSWTTSFDALDGLCPGEAVHSGEWVVHFCTTCQAEDAGEEYRSLRWASILRA
ncbi:hypothetical protein B484DRAFT_404552 [Ochromonadaceae sp. CCMP2298]|nr:hypothetical protein B484DRAFT_404552 [Ochromonadaceae sp. CCMP2298]